MTTEEAAADTEKTADELVGRLFEAYARDVRRDVRLPRRPPGPVSSARTTAGPSTARRACGARRDRSSATRSSGSSSRR